MNHANKEELTELREMLATCSSSEWVKAQCIMNEATSLTKHKNGPIDGSVAPRSRKC